MIQFLFWGLNAYVFTNSSLHLCIKVAWSLLHHKKDDLNLPNSGAAKKKLVTVLSC